MQYRDLQPGDRFRFVYGIDQDRLSPEVHAKAKGQWYRREQDGRMYSTGAKTTVRLEPKQEAQS